MQLCQSAKVRVITVVGIAAFLAGFATTYSLGQGGNANAEVCIPSIVLANDVAGIAKVTDNTDSHPRVSDMINNRTLVVVSEPLIEDIRQLLVDEIERCHRSSS